MRKPTWGLMDKEETRGVRLHGTGIRDKGQVQAGMLTSLGDSAGISLVFAAPLMESEMTQLAPANAVQIALPAQVK
jgi:hypothetical protein